MITKKYLNVFLIFSLFLFSSSHVISNIYVNDMDYVLGDAKQAFIQDRVNTQQEAENLLTGFKAMQVNGIRIPIFSQGLEPNKAMLDYFYTRAVEEGFLIFANPAQHSGGQRIANGTLSTVGESVLNNNQKTNNLINRITAFAQEYPSTWINPFNEDGQPGGAWSAAQMNTIYSSLENVLNGAQLIGPGVWGLPGSIGVLEGTDILNHVSVVTSHNLGFNHNRWPEFISYADERGLPVWDSEVTHNDPQGNGTRLEAAIENNVDGLVLYNSWNTININTGAINNFSRELMSLYLKPVVSMKKSNTTSFAIDGNHGGVNGQNVYIWNYSSANQNQHWIEIDRGNGYYSYQKRNTNFCLDGNRGGENGQSVYLWQCGSGNQNQHWRKVSVNGLFRLEKRNAPSFSIDGNNGGANGQNLYLWQSNNSNPNQLWEFTNEN